MTSQPTPVCGDCAVRHLAVCGSISDPELARLTPIGHRLQLAPGETMVWAGDDSLACGNILSGMLKVSASTPNGREQIVGILYPADFVGRPYAEQAPFTVTALAAVEMCVFPRAAFERLLEEHPRLERALLRRMMSALDDARARMLMLARKSAEERIAGFLIEMADRLAPRAFDGIALPTFDLPLSRGQIADVLGLTIETVSRQMTRFKGAGLIRLPGGRAVTIVDGAALEHLAEAA